MSDQIRKALEMAVRQNEHDMLMTGDELRKCRDALSARPNEPSASVIRRQAIQDCRNCYSPDDSAADWDWKMIQLFITTPQPTAQHTDAAPHIQPAQEQGIFCPEALNDLFNEIDTFPELNMNNYGDDEVRALNYWGGRVYMAKQEVLASGITELQPAQQRDSKDAWISVEDMAYLMRFQECCEDSDSGGHDVPKDCMKRLAEIGVVQSVGFGKHQITSFGDFVIAKHFDQSYKLPLQTIEEYNRDAAIAATQEVK